MTSARSRADPTVSTCDATAADLDRREPAELVRRLTLEQKVRLLTGADFWTLYGIDDIGLRPLVVSDGPVGVPGRVAGREAALGQHAVAHRSPRRGTRRRLDGWASCSGQ